MCFLKLFKGPIYSWSKKAARESFSLKTVPVVGSMNNYNFYYQYVKIFKSWTDSSVLRRVWKRYRQYAYVRLWRISDGERLKLKVF